MKKEKDNILQIDDTRYKLDTANPIVVRITSETDESRWGTGIVVAPNKVLTAAHVLKLSNLIIYQGEHKGTSRKTFTISSAKRHPEYIWHGPDRYLHDLAVLTTNEAFDTYGSFGHVEYDLLLHSLQWIGYPHDLIEKDGEISQWGTDLIEFGESKIDSLIVKLPVISTAGQSGSGLIDITEPDTKRIIGVLVGGSGYGSKDTIFTLLRGSNFDFVYEEVVSDIK
ncbi:TPA: serine protease [Bacillus thuringiensis]|nr:trypsin-like peptidase domain-containing protein [Bacillus cereus]HDR4798614.1 trypsin-like peptidase domain-containing protein [Bacillus cereus]HDR4804629.1 trypsin-like peptidase domain-containing protein [Bacillus cereus]HDR4810568.1 trypsin-like peptidase domain-containing protein [Bacillus cereus]HDR4833033.1 trypsin-like peptidase domain-containing protein [Bacillus cereus]